MADSDKDILITPQTSQVTDPSIVFSSGATGGDDVTLFVTDDGTITTLSFEGSAGQLLAVSNDLTGTIFSVNDISGIPSIEVDADGTVSLAEFDGEVGIGTAAPTEMLTITGRDVASSNTGIRVNSRGDAYLKLYADTVSDTELENAYIYMSQDADAVVSVIGTIGGANVDSQNNTFTGSTNNSLGIHHKFATGTVDIGVNGQVGLTIDDSNNVTVKNGGAFTGDGSGLTTLTAANISSGSLASGVNLYQTAQSANSSYHVMFSGATTGVTASGNYTANFDNGSGDFIYNPFTNTLTVGEFSGGGASVTNVDAVTLNGATESDAAGNSTIVKRTGAGYIYCNFVNSTSGATATALSHIWVETGNDSFIRQQTIANFRTNVVSGATIAGDVTGTIGATVVGNDSHTHAFNNLTSKGSGTGNYLTTGQMQAAAGFHGSYDDGASGSWAGPIWGMDDGFTGPTGGINALATGCYGLRWNRASASVANSKIGEGVYVYQNGVLEAGMGTGGTYSVGNINTDGNMIINGTGGDYISISHDGTDVTMANLGTRYIDMELTSVLEFRVQDSNSASGITSGAQVKDHAQVMRDVGFNHVKEISFTASDTLEDIHAGCILRKSGTGTLTLTLAADSQFPVGSMCTVLNHGTGGSLTISDGSEAMYIMDGSGTVSDNTGFVLAVAGCITIWRQGLSAYYVWGAGIP